MTEPFDPYRDSMRPVDYPHPGSSHPYPGQMHPHPGSSHPYPGRMYPYPGQMRDIDQSTTAPTTRPATVVTSFVLWLSAALSWPIGTVLQTLTDDDATFTGFASVMTLFATACIGAAGIWGAVMLLNGSYNARLALVGGSMVIGVLALAAAIVAARDGDTGPLGWTVMVLRLALPAAATVFCFLPGTRQYFTGNMG